MFSRAGLALTLAFYETRTNAIKYGALSSPKGTVSIEWALKEEDETTHLEITCQEVGGPPVATAQHSGSGTLVITEAVAAATDGKVYLDFDEGGLRWSLVMQVGDFDK